MRHLNVRLLAAGALAALALAACSSSSKSSAPPATSPPTAAPTTAATPTTTASSSGSATPTVALASVNNAKANGKKVLVDKNGMTLYVWDNDKTPGKADCTGVCAKAWPPLYVTGTPTYGSGLSTTMFSTVTGPNGQKQLAVNGKPLYLWAADKKAGDATGDGINGFYVVAANGDKIDSD
jgi:predicted lipoprotein with Yx(FWY)xxD motif